jgi:hypothetical protein
MNGAGALADRPSPNAFALVVDVRSEELVKAALAINVNENNAELFLTSVMPWRAGALEHGNQNLKAILPVGFF